MRRRGLLVAALGAYGSRRQFLLRRKGQRVTGTVTRIDRHWDSGDPPGYSYWPVLSFQTLAGQQIETRSAGANSEDAVVVGQQVRVIYNPANPGFAEIDTFGNQAAALLLPLIAAAVGIGLVVAGIVTMTGR